jgi:hypothetical protein
VEETLEVEGNGGGTGNYGIGIGPDIKNGRVTASRSRADKGQIITVKAVPAAPSEWQGEGPPPVVSAPAEAGAPEAGGEAAGGETAYQTEFPWYTGKLVIKQDVSGKTVLYTKQAVDTWIFKMPDEDVTISATFTQIPNKSSAELLRLDVSAGQLTMPVTSGNLNYTADVPHFYNDEKFFIEAEAENPGAEVKLFIGEDETESEFDRELALKEGKSNRYRIEVTSEDKSKTNIYNLTASYSPDMSIKFIKLESPASPGWSQFPPVLDEQEIAVPYDKVNINAEPNAGDGNGVKVEIKNNGTITSTTRPVTVSLTKTTADGATYQKNYILKIRQGAENFPTKSLAAGGGVTFVPVNKSDLTKGYYEIHEFRSTGEAKLTFTDPAAKPATAEVLVVAGGGGGGGGCGTNTYVYGGGGGAGGVVYKSSFALSKQSYDVFVGDGGNSGGTSQPGVNGQDSKFDSIKATGGGGGGRGGKNGDIFGPGANGNSGGSGGGGGSSMTSFFRDTSGGSCISGQGTAGKSPVSEAGGAGGGLEFSSDITSEKVVYAKGGLGKGGGAGTANTGNGGSGKDGATNTARNKGGSGIVVVRFMAASPSAQH